MLIAAAGNGTILFMMAVQAFAIENGHVRGDVANHRSCGRINDQEHDCLLVSSDSRGDFHKEK